MSVSTPPRRGRAPSTTRNITYVVLGTAVGFTPPPVDPSLRHFFERPDEAEREKIPSAMLDPLN